MGNCHSSAAAVAAAPGCSTRTSTTMTAEWGTSAEDTLDSPAAVKGRTDAGAELLPAAAAVAGGAKFDVVFDSLPIGLLECKLDARGTITRVNRHAGQLFGYEPGQMAGKSVDDLVPLSIRHAHAAMRAGWHACPASRAMGAGRDLKAQRKDGSLFPVEVGLNPVTVGGVTYALVTVLDLTYRVKAIDMEKAAAEAMAASKARGDTLSTMSHEIRNPLNGVIGTAALLLDLCTTEEQRELASTIAACGEATLTIINDILDWSKIDAGRMTIENIPFAPGEMVRDVLDIMKAAAEDRGVQLTAVEMKGGVVAAQGTLSPTGQDHHSPAAATTATSARRLLPSVRILGDPTRVRQIVLNWVSNSIKFVAEDRSGKVTIRVGLLPVGRGARAGGDGPAPTPTVLPRASVAPPLFLLKPIPDLENEPVSRGEEPGPAAGTARPSERSPATSRTEGAGDPAPLVLPPVSGKPLLSPAAAVRARAAEAAAIQAAAPIGAGLAHQQSWQDGALPGGRLQLSDAQYELVVSVEDNGVGMSPEVLSRLFTPFTQASASTARKHGGTGLGLSICKSLTELMGGRIEVTSTPGKGSAFTLHLPCRMVVKQKGASHSTLNTSSRTVGASLRRLSSAAAGSAGGTGLGSTVSTWYSETTPAPLGPTSTLAKPSPVPELRAVDTGGTAAAAAASEAPASTQGSGDAAADVTAAMSSTASGPLLQQQGLAGARVLLVDDNAVNRRLASTMLMKLGCSVETAVDGAEAVAAWRRSVGLQQSPAAASAATAGTIGSTGGEEAHPYDLVLMDCRMPVMDGLEATEEIRRLEAGSGSGDAASSPQQLLRRTPILALTASAMPEDRERCTAAGMDGVITKPVRMRELQAGLMDALAAGEPGGSARRE